MFNNLKNITAILILIGSLAGCAAQPPTGGMKMDPAMCKKMMAEGKCGCCQSMGDMSGGQTMQCMPQNENKTETPPPAVNPEEHKKHHPAQ
jgi:hypothetical protein